MMAPQFYLFFKGDCLEAMTHYAKTLGGAIEGFFLNKDAATPEERMPRVADLVMKRAMRLGDTLMLASDNSEEMYERPQGLRIQIETPSGRVRPGLCRAGREGASDIPMPPGETFWAGRFAMFTARFGTPWMLNLAGARSPDATA